ncbi:tautomerase family protein [Amantichitinum ursilacus]|uniref:Tautomerase enzyme n=1 Tax=Amantichitinum ursilacus TaxID=857265 RepID=A0A0N0GPM9_9NEIS|nr:tautomerase family protein [Amantichitinum ursilacus]KPC53891.1 Tautomerase enzyme [Amantichitinum ursilacus]
MPFAHIHLNASQPVEWLDAISSQLQTALETTFEVPANDLFQAFYRHQPGELRYHPTYLGGPRTEQFVLIHLFTGRARSNAVKQTFYARLVQLLGVTPGIAPENVMILINDMPMSNWSFGGGVSAAPQEA